MKSGNQRREAAAQMLAEDRYSDLKIAGLCGIHLRTLGKWKVRPEFAARVKELSDIYADRALRFGLARKERRLTVLSEMHEKLVTIVEERAKDPGMANIPGGNTGLVLRRFKALGKGRDFQVVESYEADTKLLRELRGIQEQIADELGQVIERHEVTEVDKYKFMTDEQLEARLTELVSRYRDRKAEIGGGTN